MSPSLLLTSVVFPQITISEILQWTRLWSLSWGPRDREGLLAWLVPSCNWLQGNPPEGQWAGWLPPWRRRSLAPPRQELGRGQGEGAGAVWNLLTRVPWWHWGTITGSEAWFGGDDVIGDLWEIKIAFSWNIVQKYTLFQMNIFWMVVSRSML